MGSVLQWLLRRGLLYGLLVLAIAFGPVLWHAIFGSDLRSELMSPSEVSREFERLKEEAGGVFEERRDEIAGYPAAAVDARLGEARAEFLVVGEQLKGKQGWFASIRPQSILTRKRLELRQAAVRGEIRLLELARERHALRSQLQGVRSPTDTSLAAARGRCDAANAEVHRFNARHELERSVRAALRDEARQLTGRAAAQCGEYVRQREARKAAHRTVLDLQAKLAKAQVASATADVEAQDAIAGTGINLTRTLQSVLIKAGVLLLGIIVTPYAIRLVFYFCLAPLVERRPPVRLWPSGSMQTALAIPQQSATSAPIMLGAGEELLVRQGFLQSTSSRGKKATRALLDWRHPLSSLASGLSFLTRIEGEGETTTVSAVHDPFAEVAVLDLPPGAACVLQPRALVAVVQFAGRPIHITSHWRLGSLHAWLTLQLRYLMFHGPARLVIKGGRGVRVERAERGRVFGQDQLVGFSADLAYSVTRTETFWPYLIGLEVLLKDKVEAGEGLLIIEEAPMATGGRAVSRKGLEGAADVLLKAVGI